MGINIGAFVCNFVAAYLAQQIMAWGYAFAAAGAGLGMLLGMIIFGIIDLSMLGKADVKKPVQAEDMSLSHK